MFAVSRPSYEYVWKHWLEESEIKNKLAVKYWVKKIRPKKMKIFIFKIYKKHGPEFFKKIIRYISCAEN